jgi:uncharacterized membrane protein
MVDIPQERKADNTHRIETSIECEVPVRTAYNQWTQFESFPQFMEGVEQVEQVDDTNLHWVARVAGKRVEWDAKIVGQEPDKLISWASTSGRVTNGNVEFQELGPSKCRIDLVMTYEPEGAVENLGDWLGIVRTRVQGDLRRFKEFIESRRVETGAWRGEVRSGQVTTPGASGGSGSLGGSSGIGKPPL